MFNEVSLSTFNLSSTNLNKLSAQYNAHPKFEINPNIKTEYDSISTLKKSKSTTYNISCCC